ncbi:MAG: ATP-dependent Clp protease adapter ClpS [Pseudobacteriovorax sp.]|nr:ATP-dependent Clp protease adapter ClpS [Pseudobacteriovorax sp.]
MKPVERQIPTLSQSENDSGVAVSEKVVAKKPPLYVVLLLNDDYTPMEFVVSILERHFDKDHAAATDIMLKVHNDGQAPCGVYPYEIAETKVAAVTDEARQQGFPLQCTMEKE